MEKLGPIDELFYKADQYKLGRLVMAGASVLAPAAGGSRLDAAALAEHLAARLERVPELRKRFVRDPLRLGSVHKVDDPDFDVWDHLDVIHLEKPGNHEQLERALAAYLNEDFGLNDLWRWRVIGGLKNGRVAIVNKIHHALIDGMGARQMMEEIFDTKPGVLESPAGIPLSESRPVPNRLAMLGKALAENFDRTFIKAPRFIYRNARPAVASVKELLQKQRAGTTSDKSVRLADTRRTSLNYVAHAGNPRTLSYLAFTVDDFKALASHFDCKINDICLLLYSCALQKYFDSVGEQIDFDLNCAMPISVRDTGAATGGNQITGAFVLLHNREKDLVKRLQKITADAKEVKNKARARQSSSGVDFDALSELVYPAILDIVLHLADRIDLLGKLGNKRAFFNTFLTNMPGPREILYLANARLDEGIPLVPAIPVIAVSPGVVSHGHDVVFGFNCDATVVKDPKVFTDGLELGFRELQLKAGRAGIGKIKAARSKKKSVATRAQKKPVEPTTKTRTIQSSKKTDSKFKRGKQRP